MTSHLRTEYFMLLFERKGQHIQIHILSEQYEKMERLLKDQVCTLIAVV